MIGKWFKKTKPEDFFLKLNPRDGDWRVVSWNFDLQQPGERKTSVEIHGKEINSFEWVKSKKEEVAFYQNQKLVQKFQISEKKSELKSMANLAIHSTLKFALERNYDFMLSPVSGVTALDFQSENRALQWIQASFGTLVRALEEIKSRNDLILTSVCFMGREPGSGDEVVRVLVLNLDIFYYLRPDKSLHVIVFDDKNLGHGESKNPAYQQIIKVTKPQFYDEITKMIHMVALAGEIR